MEHALMVGRLQPYLMEEKNKYSQFIPDHASYPGYQLCVEAQALFFFYSCIGEKTRKYQNQR